MITWRAALVARSSLCIRPISGALPLLTAAGSFWKYSAQAIAVMLTSMLACSALNCLIIFRMIGPSPPVSPFQKASLTGGPS